MTANVFSLHTAQPALQWGLIALSKVCFPSLLSSSYPLWGSMRHSAFRFGWEMSLPCCRCLWNKRLASVAGNPFLFPIRADLGLLSLFNILCLAYKHFLEASLTILWTKYVRNPESTWDLGRISLMREGSMGCSAKSVQTLIVKLAWRKVSYWATVRRQSWSCTGPK